MNREGISSISELAAVAQQKRIKRAQESLGFVDKLRGRHVEAGTVANNVLVDTLIISGNAKLRQEWHFNKDGHLERVQIYKELNTRKGSENVSYSRLGMDEGGRFRLERVSKAAPEKLSIWNNEFRTVARRLKNRV